MCELALSTTDDSTVVLENDLLRCEWGVKEFSDGAVNHVVTALTDLRTGTSHEVRQIDGVWMGYGVGRGTLESVDQLSGSPDELTVHMEWEKGVVERVTVFPRAAVIRFRYLSYGVNVVDIFGPGGAKRGVYVAHGADDWHAQRAANTSEPSRSDANEHHRLTDDLYPNYPNPLYRSVWGGTALEYNGWIIIGLCNKESGAGIGRLMPASAIDVLKLLHGRGFEFFPFFGRDHEAYTSYLYLVTDGPDEVLRVGRSLAEEPL